MIILIISIILLVVFIPLIVYCGTLAEDKNKKNSKKEKRVEVQEKRNKIGLFDLLVMGALFTPSQNNLKKDSDLEDWQQDLVNKGAYDSFNFEESELEDDDYYNEDVD